MIIIRICYGYFLRDVSFAKFGEMSQLNRHVQILSLTNCPKSFMNIQLVETGLSDFHNLTLLVLKMYYAKPSPKIVTYRNCKNISKGSFRSEVLNEIGRTFILLF